MSCGGSSLLVSGNTQPGVALVDAVSVARVSIVRMLALAVLVTRCPEYLYTFEDQSIGFWVLNIKIGEDRVKAKTGTSHGLRLLLLPLTIATRPEPGCGQVVWLWQERWDSVCSKFNAQVRPSQAW